MSSSATVTVLFCDVVGSTERLVRLGDIAADEDRRALFTALSDAVTRNDGEVVKHLGDGLMIVFEHSAVRALSCARDLHVAAAAIDEDDPIRLRVGISAGEVAHEQGDWFGLPVVEAARLCNAAAPGQTLANAVVRHLVGSRAADHRITGIGALPLKGLAAPLQTVDIAWRDDPSHPVPDPVVSPVAAPDGTPIPTPSGSSDDPAVPGPEPDDDRPERPLRRRRTTTLAVAGLLAVALVGGGLALSSNGRDGSGDESGDGEPIPLSVAEPRGYTPTLEPAECPAEVADTAPEAVCRNLIVPESRADPDGPKVAVPVTSIYADDPTADPVVLVDVNEPVSTTSLTEVANVHALGLRGFATGGRPELDCPEVREAWTETLRLPADAQETVDRRVDAARRCADRLRADGVQLDGYDMAEVADDIRDLVIADDLGPVNVAGGGFTTTAVASFARREPDAVSALLLTNPVAPGDSPLGDPVHSLEKSFEQLVDLCRKEEQCDAAHPDVHRNYMARFDALNANPVMTSATTLVGTGPHDVLLDGRRWAAALESAMFQSDRLGLVPEAVEGASDELAASTGIDEEARFFIAPSARAAATLSYLCAYDAIPNRTAEISAQATPEFAGANEASFGPICTSWGVRSDFEQLSRPLTGDVPVLIAQGDMSFSGANRWGQTMAAHLDRATLVRFPTMSADLAYSPPPCLRKLRNEFLVDPAGEHDTDGCAEESPDIEFVGR